MAASGAPSNPFDSVDAMQAHLAAIVAYSDDGIVSKDLNGIVQSWNQAAERIFGYSAQEMIGQPILRIIPEDRSHEEPQILDQLRRGERVDHFRTIRVRKDGRRIAVLVTISPIRNKHGQIIGASKIVRDLTPSFDLERRFEAIVTFSDDAIVSKDLNGIVQSWNQAAERIFGYSAQEMIGQPIARLLPPDRPDEERQILSRLRRGERVDHFETVRRRKDGRLIDVSVTISPIRDVAGTIVGASKIARDITQLKQLARERELLLVREQAARQEAERVSRVKDEFLATLSHELRTPLNAILGWAQLLRSKLPNPEHLEQGLETIDRNARAQTRLIEDLLDISRIISGKMRLDVQRVDLQEVIAAAIESVRPAADNKSVRLLQIIDPKAGPVTGDPARLQQVVWNLLTNAVKFTPKGGSVQVYLQRINSHIEITVADTGQGIAPDFLPHLFTRFSQADSSTTREHAGLGLGLAIVRHLVELHGGRVHATSAGEGQGATFTVALPLAVVLDTRSPAETVHPTVSHDEPQRLPTDLNLKGIKVLVVDDELDARDLVKHILEMSGSTVMTAASAREAFEVFQREQPDVLLSDVGMPEEDGYQLIRKVRALPRQAGGAVPAVAFTAFARAEDRRQALLAGFQFHLSKPVEALELVTVVASLTGATGTRDGDREQPR